MYPRAQLNHRTIPRAVAAAACALVFSLGGSVSGAQPAEARYIAPEVLGQHLMFNSALNPLIPVHAMRLWDSSTGWCEIEPAPGQYDFWQLDNLLAQSTRLGADVEFTFGWTPAWARGQQATGDPCAWGANSNPSAGPTDEQSWKRFVAAVAQRGKGKIRAYELWNEFNDPNFWSGGMDQIVRMSVDAAAIIHRIDPSAAVLSPSVTATPHGFAVLRDYLSRLPAGTIDGIAVHTYTSRAWPETALPKEMEGLKAALPAAYAQLPLWSTEGGWGQNKDLLPNSAASLPASDERAFMARYDLMILSEGFARSYWYAYQNTQWGTLFDGVGLTPAGVAARTLDAWLVGATLDGCASADGNVWSCGLTTASGRRAEVAWATKSAVWRSTAGYRRVDTLVGTATAASGAVQLGYEPIRLSTEDPPPGAGVSLPPVAPHGGAASGSRVAKPVSHKAKKKKRKKARAKHAGRRAKLRKVKRSRR